MLTFRSVRSLLSKTGDVIESLTKSFPRFYLACVTLLALFGYLYVLLFPLLVIAGILNIYESVAVSAVIDWQSALTWLAVVIVASLVSYRSAQFKPAPPVGLTLTEDKAPELFALVQQYSIHFKRPLIHRIVLTANYELDIVKTPKWALPVWSSNTMIIGLPVMQCHPPKQFERMVARRTGQFSKRDNFLTNWLYQLRSIWQQYRVSYGKQKGFGIEPLRWYFAVYAPFYAAVSVYAARRDELIADSYAMELFNDEEVREMITADELCRWWLQNQFWPAVYKIASVETKSLPTPHTKMAAAVHASMSPERLESLMVKFIKEKSLSKHAKPSLQSRIENIGHNKARMSKPVAENAASRYLGSSMKGVIDLIDKLWLKTFLEKRKRQHQQKQKQVTPEQVTSA